MLKETKAFQRLSKSMLLQCSILFAGICAGLWISEYCFLIVAMITIVTSFFGKFDSAYYQLFFTLPFTMIYKLSPSSSSLFVYVVLVSTITLIVRKQSLGKDQLLFLIIFASYIIVGMGKNYTTVLKMISGFALFYIFVAKISSANFKNHIIAFSLGMILSSSIGLLKGNWQRLDMYYSNMKTIYIGDVQSFRFTGLYLDPNYYSISVIFALTLCLMLFLCKDGNRIFLGAMIGMLLIFGIMSYSKMFLLTACIVILIFVLSRLRSLKQTLLTMVVLLICGGGLYKWMQSSGYIQIMTDRIFDGDISTGRFGIWKSYIKYIIDSPKTLLFGDGLGAEYLAVGGPHNTYIEIIYFLGLIGEIIFALVLFSTFRVKKYNNKRSIINYALPTLFCIMIAPLGCLTINDLMFYFILIWIGLNYDVNDEKQAVNISKGRT